MNIPRPDQLFTPQGDQSLEAIEIEMNLFYSNKDFHVTRHGKNIELISNNIKVNLRNDTLITYKQMYKRLFGLKKYKQAHIENDEHLYSFMPLPHIVGGSRCQLNSKRASLATYNDNPFIFFKVLHEMYLCDFNKADRDEVEELIMKKENVDYWKMFGSLEEGYQSYLHTYCLDFLLSWENSEEYHSFFEKKYLYDIENRELFWNHYLEMMQDFIAERSSLMEKNMAQAL